MVMCWWSVGRSSWWVDSWRQVSVVVLVEWYRTVCGLLQDSQWTHDHRVVSLAKDVSEIRGVEIV